MTDQELRALVREAIARQLGRASRGPFESSSGAPTRDTGASVSYAQFAVPSGPEGSCIIEPAVMCNHCGFCKSYGH